MPLMARRDHRIGRAARRHPGKGRLVEAACDPFPAMRELDKLGGYEIIA